MLGSKPKTTRPNYHGTDVVNSSDCYVPEDVLQAAANLRQLLIDYNLQITVTIKHCAISN